MTSRTNTIGSNGNTGAHYIQVPFLIGLVGPAGSGKDTVARFLVEHCKNFEQYAFATPIKAALNAMFGWSMGMWEDREWKEAVDPVIGKSPRECAQTLGTEWGRDLINPELWLNLGIQRATNCRDSGDNLVISDVRFPNEERAIRLSGGVIWHIDRDVEAVAAHSSEGQIQGMHYDPVIDNNGSMDELYDQVAKHMSDLRSLVGE
jgi:hypothetical protein